MFFFFDSAVVAAWMPKAQADAGHRGTATKSTAASALSKRGLRLPQGGRLTCLLAQGKRTRRCTGHCCAPGADHPPETTCAADTACTARAPRVTAYGSTVQLHLHGADLRSLAVPADEAALRKALEADLQTLFCSFNQANAASDLFPLGFWQQCVYG